VQRDERDKPGAVPFVPEHQPLGKRRQGQQLAGRMAVIMGRVSSCSQQRRQNFVPKMKAWGWVPPVMGREEQGRGALHISCSLGLLEAQTWQHGSSLVSASCVLKVLP